MKQNHKLKDRCSARSNIELSTTPEFPKNRFLIELSNICNHKCLFCAQKKMTKKRGEMPLELVYRLLQEAYDEGTKEVGFYTTGEPLAAKNLVPAIKKAKEIGYDYVYITTNGGLANEEKIIPVIQAGIDSIKISINAGDRETYKIIHGVDDFDEVIKNLKFIDHYRKHNNLSFNLYISFVVTNLTAHQIESFREQYKEFCDEIIFINVANQGGLNSEIKNLIMVEDKNKAGENFKISLPCPLLFNSINITYEGYLTACCTDFQNYLIIADLNKMSLKEAWHCKKYQEFRQAHINRNVQGTICHNCVSYSTKPFMPLSPEYASEINFETIYDEENITSRLNKKTLV